MRTIVIGNCGTGKSTLGAALARRLNVPFIELDELWWGPRWTPAGAERMRERLDHATQGDAWVIAGNYFRHSRPLTWPRAERLVFLDYEMGVVMRRLILRTLKRWWFRERCCGDNREHLWEHCLPWDRSLFYWALKQQPIHKRRWRSTRRDPELRHLELLQLRRPAEAEAWLAQQSPRCQ